MDYQIKVTDERAFKCPSNVCGIGASATGYALYHAIGFGGRPADDAFTPYVDGSGTAVEVEAGVNQSVVCAAGTWFKLIGNTGEVAVTY